jgi:hypothetical protein
VPTILGEQAKVGTLPPSFVEDSADVIALPTLRTLPAPNQQPAACFARRVKRVTQK